MVPKSALSAAFLGTCLAAPAALAQSFSAGYSSGWWSQTGLTSGIESTARGGAGVGIGLVDTGVAAANAELAGRVSSLSGCAAVTFSCSHGAADDNGHGTATAAIAAGGTASGGWMSGVAPLATIVAAKALNSSGTGYDTDIASGIIKAANAGVGVINLSLTYLPTGTVVNAINYAASKGIYMVFAGGNSAAPLNGGVNTTGLSAAALGHLVFVGSVNGANALSSFSGTPGGGRAGTASYASLWLMAPGENIVAPGILYGANSYAYWTGTSMAAPMVSGAIALLEARWPVLRGNGTAAAVLFGSATDLGGKGVDGIYGNGLLNISQAFQPIGSLTLPTGSGTTTTTATSASLVSSGAIGVRQLSALMSNVTAFDSFQRDFQVNLSGGITTKSQTPTTASALPTTTSSTTTRLADGGSLNVTQVETTLWDQPASSRASLGDSAAGSGLGHSRSYRLSYSGADGQSLALGKGLDLSRSFSEAAWSPGSAFAESGTASGSALMALVPDGTGAAWGGPVGRTGRVAVGFASSGHGGYDDLTGDRQRLQALSLSYTEGLAEGWTVGLGSSMLAESNSLLGSASGGALALGNHHTAAVTLGTEIRLDDRLSLAVDATYAGTDGGTPAGGLVDRVSGLHAFGFGSALLRHDAFEEGDTLTAGLSKPLRVYAGQADLTLPVGADASGAPVMRKASASLVPDGSQTDLTLGYHAPLLDGAAAGFAQFRLSADQDNVQGRIGGEATVGVKIAF